MGRGALTFSDRAEIATGLKAGHGVRRIARQIGRDPSVVSREIGRNSTRTKGYQPVPAECKAERRHARPQARAVGADPVPRARVAAELKRSRTPRQIAGRLRLEAADPSVDLMKGSPPAGGKTVSHEAIYQWIYALPTGELAREGIVLRSRRRARKRRRPPGERTGGKIIGMVSIDARDPEVAGRRVPGAWEGDLIIGRAGQSAAATLVERTSRFTVILGPPEGKKADGLADILIDHVKGMPEKMRGSLTWDQGTEMARHGALTLATDMPVYFARPHSPWERPTNENTNGLIREYLPKGTDTTSHQPHLDATADELNDRPRAVLGYYTPREIFQKLLLEPEPVATTT
ncbi:MAG: IS30 family transposase [Actinomycetes bacterium]